MILAEGLSHPASLAYALLLPAVVHQWPGKGELVRERVETATALASEQGFKCWTIWGVILHGWGLTQAGQSTQGIRLLGEGLAAWQESGSQIFRPYFLALLAEGYAQAGQVEDGLRTVIDGLACVERTEERWHEAELYRLKGELTLQAGDLNEAEACFRNAIDIAQRQATKSWELRAVMSLARLWQEQGKQTEAHKLLSDSYNWFSEGFDTKDLREAKGLLEELG